MCFTLIQNEKSMQLLKKMVTNQARKKPTLQKKYLHRVQTYKWVFFPMRFKNSLN